MDQAKNQGTIKRLFDLVDLRMSLSFDEVQKTKPTLNQPAGEIITIGSVPAPIQANSGPTTRGTNEKASEMVSEAVPSVDEEESLQNVSRGDRRCTFRNDLSPTTLLHFAIAKSQAFSAAEFWRLANP